MPDIIFACSIKRVYVRILLFYIGGVTIIGLLVPYTNPDLNLSDNTAAKSPFVIAIKRAGIAGLPSVRFCDSHFQGRTVAHRRSTGH